MTPDLSHDRIDRLREAFMEAGYTADGILELLGQHAHAALGRGEPEPVVRATADAGRLGTLVRMFLLGDAVNGHAAEAALSPLGLREAAAAGIAVIDGDEVRAGLDIRPHAAAESSWWVVSDLDSDLRPDEASTGSQPGSRLREDHVLGVGQASMSLVRATSRRQVDSVLDIGTGCGVQALHAGTHARRITATDVSRRALALAAATFRLNRIDVELLEGQWLEPVAGRRFDQVVCNPPFVVGPARTDYVYRDSGLEGDAAGAMMVGDIPALLSEGGTGQLLASWLHREGESWQERVSGWVREQDVDAWFVQRDIADPALYVGTWLRDAGFDPRSGAGRAKAAEWLNWFEANRIDGVGFGFVTLRRTGGEEGEVVCEDLRHAFDDPLGPESDGWLERIEWLRRRPSATKLFESRLVTSTSTVLEQISSRGEEGWSQFLHRLHRTDGPGWQHEIDEMGVRLLAGCHGAMPVGDLIGLLSAGYGADEAELARSAEPMLRELVRHGMLLPAEWEQPR